MIKKALSFLGENYSRGGLLTCNGVRINRNNFQSLSENKERVYAVDGGSSVLFDGGSWFIAKIRVGHVEYDVNKIGETSRKVYVAGFFNDQGLNVEFFPDSSLAPTNKEVSSWVSELSSDKIPDLVTRIMKIVEWNYVYELITKIVEGTILVDSLLMEDFPHHKKYMERALQAAVQKKLVVIGFCKTSRLASSNGRPLVSVLKEMGPERPWAFPIPHPTKSARLLGEDYAVKLHEKSEYVFRVQVEKTMHQGRSAKDLLGSLVYYSKDPEIMGYPFPLYTADKLVRIGHFENRDEFWEALTHEAEYKFLKDRRASDFHGVMDRRAYK